MLWIMKGATRRMMILRRLEGVDLLGKLEPHCQDATLESKICKILFPRHFLCIEKPQEKNSELRSIRACSK